MPWLTNSDKRTAIKMSFRRRKGRGHVSHGSNPSKKGDVSFEPKASITWDFSQTPDRSVDDWISAVGNDENGIYVTQYGKDGGNLRAEYNQTVDGRDNCVKWTAWRLKPMTDPASPIWRRTQFQAHSPYYSFVGNVFQGNVGRIEDFPNLAEGKYSKYDFSFEYYVSSTNIIDSVYTQVNWGLFGTANHNTEDTIVNETWTELSVTDKSIAYTSNSGIYIAFDSPTIDSNTDNSIVNAVGDFVAIRNLKFTLKP